MDAQNFPKFPKMLKVFQSATSILLTVVSCKKNCFINVCSVFLFIDDFFGFVSFLLCLVSFLFRFLFYNHPVIIIKKTIFVFAEK